MNSILRTKKFRFFEEGLAGDVFFDRNAAKPEKAAIFLYGFPSFPGPNPATEALVAAGYLVVEPHYFGTYDSDGLFSAASMVETVAATASLLHRGYLTQAKEGKRFETPSQIEVCVGHSFGSAAAIRGIQYAPDAKALVLLAPTAHYSRDPDFGVREDGIEHLDYVRASHPRTYRLADNGEWNVLLGTDPLPTEPFKNSLSRVCLVFGEKDTYFDLSQAVPHMPTLVAAYAGDVPKLETVVLGGRGHPLNELLDGPGAFDLSSFVSDVG